MGLALQPIETPRILVVDDESQITRVLSTVLESRGYQVQTAGDGEGALTNILDWNPGLVIMDLAMPNPSGANLCHRIRLISRVPIIVLSVRTDRRAKAEALDSGADDYVTKPFGMEELLARVRAALRRAGPPSAIARAIASGPWSG
jgi:two-component system KDP operon response regulator KdpE